MGRTFANNRTTTSQLDSVQLLTEAECLKILRNNHLPPLTDESVLFEAKGNKGNPNELIRFGKLPKSQRSFFDENVRVTIEQAVAICTDPGGQKSEAWKAHRSVRITASKARSLITYISNKSPDWDQKVRKYLGNKFQGCAATTHGVRAEPYARACYAKNTGFEVREAGLLIHPGLPWLGCSLDGMVLGNRTVEFKCPVEGQCKSAAEVVFGCSYVNTKTENFFLKEKEEYYVQVQLGMFITNLKKCDFVIYSSFDDTYVCIPVQYNSNLVLNDYIPKLQFVYFSYVLRYLTFKQSDLLLQED